jgi:hypothetical protein
MMIRCHGFADAPAPHQPCPLPLQCEQTKRCLVRALREVGMVVIKAEHDLHLWDFPFTIEARLASAGRDSAVVWCKLVTGPGMAWIPPLAKQYGEPVSLRILWPDGSISEQPYR